MIKITGLFYKEDERTIDDILRQGISEKESDSFAEAAWTYHPYDEVVLYDFEEQVYKKRKVYFHISHAPLNSIRPKVMKKYRTIPAAFFAMDVQTCVDFFKEKYKFFDTPAFLHRCVNNRAMNLFNPASDADVDSLNFDPQKRDVFLKMLQPVRSRMLSKNIRYWRTLEDDTIMNIIYARTKCDGMALDFYNQGVTSWTDRTEGFCLFDRGINAINVIDVARIDNIQTSPVDPKKLAFWDAKSPELLS
jgi:hypothetical protein